MARTDDLPAPVPAPPLVGPKKPPGRPLVGDVNVLEVCIGQRGSGKTTFECFRAYELAYEFQGAYVIGHSLGPRFPRTLPPTLAGRTVPLDIVYHPTLAKLEQGLLRHPAKWHILAPPLPGEGHVTSGRPDTADDLLQFAVRLSTSLRRRAWEREHPLRSWHPNVDMLGLSCPPIIILVDEGIAVAAAGRDRDRGVRESFEKMSGDEFLRFLYSIRHLHIALLWNLQEPSSRSWRILEAATALHIFRIRHQWALNAIAAAGATPEQLDEIQRLPKYSHVTITPADDFDQPDHLEGDSIVAGPPPGAKHVDVVAVKQETVAVAVVADKA